MFSKTGVVGTAHDLYAWDRQQLELTVCKDSVSDNDVIVDKAICYECGLCHAFLCVSVTCWLTLNVSHRICRYGAQGHWQ